MDDSEIIKELKIAQKMFEIGKFTGELFFQEVDKLLDKHKTEFSCKEEYLYHRLALMHLGGDILTMVNKSRVRPEIWPDFLSIIRNHLELMFSEAGRIRKENNG